MNKTDLINELSAQTTFTKKDVARLMDALARTVEYALKKGEKVQWAGFGSFQISARPERMGINPSNKQRIKLPATVIPKFKPAKNFKESIKAAAR